MITKIIPMTTITTIMIISIITRRIPGIIITIIM